MPRRRSQNGLSILGPIEFDKRSEEPGVSIQGQWYGAIDLEMVELAIAYINPETIKQKTEDFIAKQVVTPVPFHHAPSRYEEIWAYRGKVVTHELDSVKKSSEDLINLIKHCVLSEDADMEKIRREVRMFENFENIVVSRREMISEEVRMFVWRRDDGKCVQCGSRNKLEYDHIIPVIEGGNSTARNIQILCETCNRRKGRSI